MFSLLVFNKDIIVKVNKWFQDIRLFFSNFFVKSENKNEVINLIKDKDTNSNK